MSGIVTVLLGSPRVDGTSERLAGSFSIGAEEKGYEIRKIRLSDKNIKPCLGCGGCWSTGTPCVQTDDMLSIYHELEKSDVIAFATPLYFYSWSAQTKLMWDRLISVYSAKSEIDLRNKKAVLIASAGDAGTECFDGLISSFRLACGYTKWKIAGIVCAPGMHGKTDVAQHGREYILKAYALGKNL